MTLASYETSSHCPVAFCPDSYSSYFSVTAGPLQTIQRTSCPFRSFGLCITFSHIGRIRRYVELVVEVEGLRKHFLIDCLAFEHRAETNLAKAALSVPVDFRALHSSMSLLLTSSQFKSFSAKVLMATVTAVSSVASTKATCIPIANESCRVLSMYLNCSSRPAIRS